MLHFCPINQIDINFGALRKKGAQRKKQPPNFPGSIDTTKLGNGYGAFGLLQNTQDLTIGLAGRQSCGFSSGFTS